jgi:hypothetical protein
LCSLYRDGSTKVLNGPKVDLDCIGETFYIEHGKLSCPTSRKTKKPSFIFVKITKVLKL